MDSLVKQRTTAWDVVRTRHGLPAPSKLAWLTIWTLAGGKPSRVTVSFAELAADQGTSERSARRCIDTLAREGLVQVDDQLPNRVIVFVWPPLEVGGRDRTVSSARERPLLDQLADPESSLQDALAEPPRVVTDRPLPGTTTTAAEPPPQTRGGTAANPPQRPLTLECLRSKQPLPSFVPLEVHKAKVQEGARTLAAVPPQPVPAGELLAQRALELAGRLPGERDYTAAIERYTSKLRQAVQGLHAAPARRIAIEVCRGNLPEKEIDSALASLRDKRLELAASGQQFTIGEFAYFVRCMRRAFARHGIAWEESKRQPVEAR